MEIKVNNNYSFSHQDNRQALKIFNEKGILGVGSAGDDLVYRMQNAAPMITTPNINANLGVLNNILPEHVEILVAEQTADLISKPKKVGFWGQKTFTFNIIEHLGKVSPDDGSANDTIRSTTNTSQVIRGVKPFAGYWSSNDLRKSEYSFMNIDIQAQDVAALFRNLATNRNNVFFTGVKETWDQTQGGILLPIYGYLNDPNLPAYKVVAASGKDENNQPSTLWKYKTPNAIANDVIVYGIQDLNTKSGGRVANGLRSGRGKLKLNVSNNSFTYLNKTETIGNSWISAKMLIEQAEPNIEIIASQELDSANNDSDVFYLIYEEASYGDTVVNSYVEMARAYPIFTKHSEVSQKITQLIGGCVVRIPMFISRWTGIENNTNKPDLESYYN